MNQIRFRNPATVRIPNCEPGETRVEAEDLVHNWKYIGEHSGGVLYLCFRCALTDWDDVEQDRD